MYPSIQAKIWGNIGQVAELLDMVLDSFIKVSKDLIEGFITWPFPSLFMLNISIINDSVKDDINKIEWESIKVCTRTRYLN